MFENVDGRTTDAGVTGILIAHLGAFGSGELIIDFINGPRREKNCLRWFAKNKGADQHAHPQSLISAFVIRLLKSMISKLASNEFSVF